MEKKTSIRAKSVKFCTLTGKYPFDMIQEPSKYSKYPTIVICCSYKPALMMKTANKPVLHVFCVPYTVLTL